MPSVAQWQGTPSVKGSSESVRMALLTASLIGLQYVLPSSMRQLLLLIADQVYMEC
jgi:hypothetical protein